MAIFVWNAILMLADSCWSQDESIVNNQQMLAFEKQHQTRPLFMKTMVTGRCEQRKKKLGWPLRKMGRQSGQAEP